MDELSITYQPKAPQSLYAPCVRTDGERIGSVIRQEVEREPMTFKELLAAIIQLIKFYMEGRRQ